VALQITSSCDPFEDYRLVKLVPGFVFPQKPTKVKPFYGLTEQKSSGGLFNINKNMSIVIRLNINLLTLAHILSVLCTRCLYGWLASGAAALFEVTREILNLNSQPSA
jgi:hypothetical protein